MELPKNTFKRALLAGKPQIGLWASLSSNYTTEVIAGAGFDWILIDTEHSPADIENVLGQLQALSGYPTTPVVRVPWNDMVTIKRVLDIGVQSLLIPQVTTAEEARDAVAFARYPTAGLRGVAGATRATRFPGFEARNVLLSASRVTHARRAKLGTVDRDGTEGARDAAGETH